MQIKEASEDMDVISKNAWIQDDIIMAGLWHVCCIRQTVFTHSVIKPQLTGRGASLSAGVAFQTWMHRSTLFTQLCQWASGMLKCPSAGFRIHRSSGDAVLESYLTSDPPGADGKEKRCSMRDSVEHKKTVWGNLWVISVPHTRQRARKHSEQASQPAGFERLGWEVHFVGLGQMRLFCSHHKSRHKKETKTTSIHLILPTTVTQLLASRHTAVFMA